MSKGNVRNGACLLGGIAVVSVLLSVQPAADVYGRQATVVTCVQPDASGPFPGQASGDLPAGQRCPGEIAATLAGAHSTRVALWASSPLSGPIAGAPVANFGMVEEGIVYRSAQPTEADYRWLLGQGFKSIVSFRREKGDNSQEVLGLGFRNYLWLNVEDEREPSDEQAERFLDFVTDPQNWPVLIHCKVGLGRTGTMAALIRYAIDGWSMQDAIMEARLYRGGVDLVPSQLEWLAHWAASHPPACHRPLAPAQSDPL